MQSSLTFERLQIEGWRQFDSIGIDIHPRLTIITGANGSGKSTLLGILSQHFGYTRNLLATPKKSTTGSFVFMTGLFSSLLNRFSLNRSNLSHIGYLKYSNGIVNNLTVPLEGSVQYGISHTQTQVVTGIHVDSHRPTPRYQPISTIQTTGVTPQYAYDMYNGEINSIYHNGYSGTPPIYRMKEALVNMALFGEGNKFIDGNSTLRDCFIGFSAVLRKILPDDIGFIELTIRSYEVVLVTKSGDFIIDAASGGVMALIDLAWRVHLFSQGKSNFVITMDEPENHLHPSMQRSLMRRFMAAFPAAQFIIVTHSPFIVSSVKDSFVYVLRYQRTSENNQRTGDDIGGLSERRVYSDRLDNVNKAGSASDILMEVLGVPATIPEWVEDSIKSIVQEFRHKEINTTTLKELRDRLSGLGFGEMYPSALAALTRNQ